MYNKYCEKVKRGGSGREIPGFINMIVAELD